MPDKPLHELAIAVAGPAVNVVIAILLSAGLTLLQLLGSEDSQWMRVGGGFVQDVIAANIILVLFNMLPAFPMDGGRVLRSLIAMRTSHLRATEIAARIGRWMALLFVIAAIPLSQFVLFVIGVFVYLSGTGELLEARRRAMAQSGSAFPWGWSSLDPRSGPARSRSGNLQDDIIDAIEVREIKRAPQSGY
jgi:Zn-dependent protease